MTKAFKEMVEKNIESTLKIERLQNKSNNLETENREMKESFKKMEGEMSSSFKKMEGEMSNSFKKMEGLMDQVQDRLKRL